MKPFSAHSIATRLTLLYTLSAFLLILLATGLLFVALKRQLAQADQQFLTDKVHVLRTILAQRPQDPEALQEEVKWEVAARRFTKFYVRVLDARGHALTESPGMSGLLPPSRFPAPAPLGRVPRQPVLLHALDGAPYRAVAAWAQLGLDGPGRRVIQVAVDESETRALLREYRHSMILVVLAGLLLSAGLGYAVARSGMAPLRGMTRVMRDIHATRLHRRIAAGRLPDELRTLAATFNDMLDRLQEAFERLSRFSADLAHELRTPLNNLRGEAEVALVRARPAAEYRQVLESSLEEYERLSRMIDSLLFLARAESADTVLEISRFDARQELEAMCAYFEAAAEEQQVSIHCTGEGMLSADRLLFQRALGNVVDNALHHTPPGGRVELAVKNSEAALRIEVTDTGCGIAPEDLPRVFDRFYRADPARSRHRHGAGLGLSLVRSILLLHQGSVEIFSEPAQGTRVVLHFPHPGSAPG